MTDDDLPVEEVKINRLKGDPGVALDLAMDRKTFTAPSTAGRTRSFSGSVVL